MVFSIFEIKKSEGCESSGIDGIAFKSFKKELNYKQLVMLKSTRFGRSTKRASIKKNKPKKSIFNAVDVQQIKRGVVEYNNELIKKLINRCKIKTFRKNYKSHSVKRVWISKYNQPLIKGSLGIPTLQDRVLQKIIFLAVHPIVEYQSDPLSFGFRPQRSALDAIFLITNQLKQLGLNNSCGSSLPVKVGAKRFNSFEGLKMKNRLRLIDKNVSKRKRKYDYAYWIAKENSEPIKINKTFHSYHKIINVEIEKCFDNIKFDSILEKYPLTSEYTFLLKA